MAAKTDRARIELATEVVRERIAKIELRGLWVQLAISVIKLATVGISALIFLLFVVLRI
jgi:hypothetical protein